MLTPKGNQPKKTKYFKTPFAKRQMNPKNQKYKKIPKIYQYLQDRNEEDSTLLVAITHTPVPVQTNQNCSNALR